MRECTQTSNLGKKEAVAAYTEVKVNVCEQIDYESTCYWL